MEHPFTTFTNILRQQVIEPIEYAVQSFDPEQPNYNPPLQQALYSKKLVPVADRTTKREAKLVKSLPNEFLRGNSTIESADELRYFSNISSIGYECFHACSNLVSISLPDSITTFHSSGGQFLYCINLREISLPTNLTAITPRCFEDCRMLSHVDIGENTIEILGSPFEGCAKLGNIRIPKNMSSISNSAFGFASIAGLTRVDVDIENEYYSSDEQGALYDKKNKYLMLYPKLSENTEYTIANGTGAILNYAFRGNAYLTKLVIPSTMTHIRRQAMAYMNSIQTLVCHATSVPYVYDTLPYSAVLYVPSQSVDLYKNDSNWKYFKEILPIEE